MKKRILKERKETFKKAYYSELKKAGVVDTKKEETLAEEVKTPIKKATTKKQVNKEVK